MRVALRVVRYCVYLATGLSLVWACGFDDTLRAYLHRPFWLPFTKRPVHFERKNVRRASTPYAGMTAVQGDSPLARLRREYQQIAHPVENRFDVTELRRIVAAARADTSLTRREREEVDLVDAKIDLRSGQPSEPELLYSARKKFEAFLRTARTPELLSEARGWLARVHYLLGDQTTAGKMYLDELNRAGSNLSREVILESLAQTYGYDGGPQLLANLDSYFDKPEYAAFAIQMVTNPHWHLYSNRFERKRPAATYARIQSLLEKNSQLLQSNSGANALALLGMRTALRMGDPPGALTIAGAVGVAAEVRSEPDFQWMLGSAHFLTRDYAGALVPLVALFENSRASQDQQAAAAYALCGVYGKTGNAIERVRFAMWLDNRLGRNREYWSMPSRLSDLSIYWAPSGFDIGLLLDTETPIKALESFIDENPNLPNIRLARYALAVRLTRADRYEEAARIYQSIGALRRAPRIRKLAGLYVEASRVDVPAEQRHEGMYRLAEFIIAHPDGIYFNDSLWSRLQRYVFTAETEYRLTRQERQALLDNERRLKDEQDERWRAYLILRRIVDESGKTEVGRRSARLAIRCLRGLSERFGREEEIRKAEAELSVWLRR
jgi:tetratricopeptide (TPR) repeat protein